MASHTTIVYMVISLCTASIKGGSLSLIDNNKSNTNTKSNTITNTNTKLINNPITNTNTNTNTITCIVGCPIKLVWTFHNSKPDDFIDIKKDEITIGAFYNDMVVNLDNIERYNFEKKQNIITVTTTLTVTINDTVTEDTGTYSCILRDITKHTTVSVTEFEWKREDRPTRKFQHGGDVVFVWEYPRKIQYQDILVNKYIGGSKKVVDLQKFPNMKFSKTMMDVATERFILRIMNATENDLLFQYKLSLVFSECCVIEMRPSASMLIESTTVASTISDDFEVQTLEKLERVFNLKSYLVFICIAAGTIIMLIILIEGIAMLIRKRKSRSNQHDQHTRRLLPPLPINNH